MPRYEISQDELAAMLKHKFALEVMYWDVDTEGTFQGVIVEGNKVSASALREE